MLSCRALHRFVGEYSSNGCSLATSVPSSMERKMKALMYFWGHEHWFEGQKISSRPNNVRMCTCSSLRGPNIAVSAVNVGIKKSVFSKLYARM
jgi:hypothetical protein